MARNWSIRTTLGALGGLLLVLLVAVGGLGLHALKHEVQTLDTTLNGDEAALRSLNETAAAMLHTRIVLDRARSLADAGDWQEAQRAQTRAQMLYRHGQDSWQRYLDTPTEQVDEGLLSTLGTRYATLTKHGIEPEIAALRANDAAKFHAIADVQVGLMSAAFDNAITDVVGVYEAHVEMRRQASNVYADHMTWMVGGGVAVAVLLLCVAGVLLGRAVVDPLKAAVAHCERIAGGELGSAPRVAGTREVTRLSEALGRMQGAMVTLVRAMHHGAESIDRGAHEIATGNADLSQRTEQQAVSLKQSAASMAHLTDTVRQNNDSARQASQLAVDAAQVAARGGDVVGAVVAKMDAITESSHRIADIIGTIEGIAFQTNILALNAAVEAARAGEQGRGFAVVAGEVRSLAQRSASAAREIKALIGTATDEVHDGAELVARAGATMNEVVQAVRRVSDIVGEISTASEAQAASIEEVTRAVGEMDASTQLNAALVEQAVAAAASLGGQTRELRGVVAGWRGAGVAEQGAASARNVSAKSVAASVSAARIVTNRANELARGTASLPTSAPSSATAASASSAAPVPTPEPALAAVSVSSSAKLVDTPPQKLPEHIQPLAPRPTKIQPASSHSDDDWETF